MEDEEKTISFKILILGESTVGKTTFTQRFCEKQFNPNNLSTAGIETYNKKLIRDNKSIFLKIFDTAGQNRYRNIVKNQFGGADGILLLYDISNKESFDMISKWIESLLKIVDKEIGLIIVGNKSDLKEKRQVTEDMRIDLEEEQGMKVMEASAFENYNVTAAFELLVDDMLKINSGQKTQEDKENFRKKKDDYDQSHSKCFCF